MHREFTVFTVLVVSIIGCNCIYWHDKSNVRTIDRLKDRNQVEQRTVVDVRMSKKYIGSPYGRVDNTAWSKSLHDRVIATCHKDKAIICKEGGALQLRIKVGSDYDYNLASLVAGALTIFAIVPVKRSHTFLAKAQIFGPSGRLFATRELHQTVNVVGGGIIFTMLVTPIVAAVGTNLKTYGNFGTVIEDVSGLFAKDIQVWLNRQSKALKTFYKRVKGVVVRPPELPSAVCGVCAAPGIAARQSKL